MAETTEQTELPAATSPTPPRVSERMAVAAARGSRSLDPEFGQRTTRFLSSHMGEDGGFRGRTDSSDLYYTVFAIEALLALGADLPSRKLGAYVFGFGSGEDLDFVHLTCLARCRARLPRLVTAQDTDRRILERIEEYRTRTGGYNVRRGRSEASAYASFLAYLAYEDLDGQLPSPHQLLRALQPLRMEDGAYANEAGTPLGNTPATAAVAVLQTRLEEPLNPATGDWLLAHCHRKGGFLAMAAAPEPDLLSTATALFALATLKKPIDGVRQSCIEFVNGLRDEHGGFRGHRADPTADGEYTFYGLLALGCLQD